MLSREENERLTEVGPGTPMGNLLRRYWYPVAASSEMMDHPTKHIQILGESLVLYRDRRGHLGLIGDTCPHRRVSMIYGIPEDDGLRCAYHGWKFDGAGKCLEMPAEPTESVFKEKVRIAAYPVAELGGMVFAYLGPEPVPLLPRWEVFVRQDALRDIGVAEVPCNWLQIMENSVDPIHVEWLHQYFNNYILERVGKTDLQRPALRHEKIGFDVFEHGIIKRRVLEGETEDNEDWKTGHPVLFPHILVAGSTRRTTFQIRVPIDDTRTMHWWYTCYVKRPGVDTGSEEKIPFYQVPVPKLDDNGQPDWQMLDFNNGGQDMIAWYSQGPVTDRTLEHLGESDQGVILYRKVLKEQLEKSARGEDPMNVFRDAAKNVSIKVQLEEAKLAGGKYNRETSRRQGGATRFSPVLDAESERDEKLTQVATSPVV